MSIEIKYTNEFGEVLTLKTTEKGQMVFNHTDIHESEDKFEDISFAQQYVFNEGEMKVIMYFMNIGLYMLKGRLEQEKKVV